MGGECHGVNSTLTPFPRPSNPYVLKKIYTCEHNVHKFLTKKCGKKFGYPRGGSYIYHVNELIIKVMIVFERVFRCGLTGTLCGIVLVDGVERCIEIK